MVDARPLSAHLGAVVGDSDNSAPFTLHHPVNDFVGHARLLHRRVALERPA